jgi:hypothetical protein
MNKLLGLLGKAPAVAFAPSSLSGLALWLDATRITGLSDGGSVATWSDVSGNGRDATQATGAKQPTYKTAIQNSKPVVRFDGGDALQTASFALTATSAVTVFLVCSGANVTDQILFEFSDNNNSHTDGFLVYRDSSNRIRASLKGDVGTTDFATAATSAATMLLAGAVFDKTLSTLEAKPYANGVLGATQLNNVNNTNAFGTYAVNIGARNQASLFLTGDVAEVILFNRALLAAERQSVESYLNTKWVLF